MCGADQCAANQVIVYDGTCQTCPPNFIGDIWGKNCVGRNAETSPLMLMAMNTENQSEISGDQKQESSKTAEYLIIGSCIGILAILGIAAFKFATQQKN